MITCSKCGAANGFGSTECRMCAHPLAQTDAEAPDVPAADALNSTVVFKNVKTRAGSSGLMECLICPECQTINHLGWLFCPQCGKKVDATFLQTMAPSDQAPTIWGTPPSPQGEPQAPVKANATADLSEVRVAIVPPAQSPSRPQPPALVTVAVEPYVRENALPARPTPQPAEPKTPSADNSTGAIAIESIASGPASDKRAIACAECGAANNAEYSFCLSCGASLPVNKTVVMASIGNPLKPRLRLLVEGKVSGPIHHINNELSIGRIDGSITFPHDALMSSRHARIEKRGSDFMLIDETSSNGTFIRVKRETRLEPGDVILVGKQLFRFEA